MPKQKCIVCTTAKGKRICPINNNELICPTCCAKIRNPECEGCIYYTQAQQWEEEKKTEKKTEHFTARIDPEVDEEVDRALQMVEGGNIERGERIITGLLQENPDLYMVQYAMGVVNAMKGHEYEALVYFDKAVEIFPYCIEAWFNKGMVHQQLYEIDKMIWAYRKVVELGDPSEGFVQHAKSILEGAEKQAQQESGIDLDTYLNAKKIFDAALEAMRRQNWREALSGFKKVLAINPKHTQSHGNSGLCFAMLGKKEEALAAFDKALELDPDYKPALLNRAAVESLKEGEEMKKDLFLSTDYFKEMVKREASK